MHLVSFIGPGKKPVAIPMKSMIGWMRMIRLISGGEKKSGDRIQNGTNARSRMFFKKFNLRIARQASSSSLG